ncbi:MAG TPA: nucleoside triphosphate pyrophosphohydrolase [Thermoanaerobaculia bacterium]|nr:nucleoside triphosphate pyrophosphohydrolase [Thermoanaerobaculia bacterium]HUM29593.1 nucleoside triphosphate pyrophosphohydrolase [Thermoanaerobaculia bacterium]HXK67244.1 nucleoside triphosphate pyrophosphohydrolase [Thermoanaerobaculia bacterium]
MRHSWNDLLEIMKRLRAPGGCPWDRAQTLETLKTFVIEEAYEVVEAGEGGDPEQLKEELGDLLLQIVFQSRIAEEEGWFTIDDVIDGISEKMVTRHPHVFGDESVNTPEEVLEKWERRKNRQKEGGLWENIPSSLPALLKAYRLGDRASQLGFDWNDPEEVIAKVEEEFEELRRARSEKNEKAVREETGDILFALAQLARHLDVEPEDALQRTNAKFIHRMRWMHDSARKKGQNLDELSLEELEALWQASKAERA